MQCAVDVGMVAANLATWLKRARNGSSCSCTAHLGSSSGATRSIDDSPEGWSETSWLAVDILWPNKSRRPSHKKKPDESRRSTWSVGRFYLLQFDLEPATLYKLISKLTSSAPQWVNTALPR